MSTAGGLAACLERVRALKVEVAQIFASSPRKWPTEPRVADDEAGFGATLRGLGVPLFVHTIYLVNLASPDAALRRRSAGAAAHALAFGARAGAAGVVTHVGSHRGAGFDGGLEWVAEAALEAVSAAREAVASAAAVPRLLLETSAGGGDSLGRSPQELGLLMRRFASKGVASGVCLDTAHLFAAGYPVHTPEGVAECLAEVDAEAGSGAVGLVHLNDSSSSLGSLADRHQNVGEGQLGRRGLGAWVRHPALRAVPFVLEVPGFDGRGPDRRNLLRARRLRAPA